MILDRESQYFIAEASRRVDADLGDMFEKHEDLLWIGCEGMSKSGKLCEVRALSYLRSIGCPSSCRPRLLSDFRLRPNRLRSLRSRTSRRTLDSLTYHSCREIRRSDSMPVLH
jgi:hypothetical protein